MTILHADLRVVVIGGGIAGCSVAYHLAAAGASRVTLLERNALGGTGTSTGTAPARSAFDLHPAEPLLRQMAGYASGFYLRIAAQSGLDLGWRTPGHVMYTADAGHWDAMRAMPGRALPPQPPPELLTPQQVLRRLPLLDAGDLLGGIWLPGDGRIDSLRAVAALTRLNRALGVTIHEHSAALRIGIVDGAIHSVGTADLDIPCEVIVIAAGAWSAEVARLCGAFLPLHAAEYQQLTTDPFAAAHDLPRFSSPDDRLYGGEDAGGVFIGAIEPEALAVGPDEPLPARWDRFMPYWQTALRRFPALQRVQPTLLRNRADAFTADGRLLLGPVPGVTGVFTACGFGAAGMASVPAAARTLAEWILGDAPRLDVSMLDVRRFSPAQCAVAYVRERVSEIPGRCGRPAAADDDFTTSRHVFRSPLHDRLTAVGARFASVAAWERATWCHHGSADSGWMPNVAKELRAAAAGVLVVDRSADAKFLLSGPGATTWLDTAAPSSLPRAAGRRGQAEIRPLPGSRGQVEALVRLATRGGGHCLVTAPPGQHGRVMEWLRRAHPPDAVRVNDDTASHASLALYGPQRASLIQSLARGGSVRIQVREDPYHAATILTLPAPSATYVWSRLLAEGRAVGLSIGGHFAEEALRIRRGCPAFGHEITPFTPTATVGAFLSPLDDCGFGGEDPIMAGDLRIGTVTSRLRLPEWPATLALGLIDFSRWRGEALQMVTGGRTWPLTPRETDWENDMRRFPDA